MIKMSLTEHAWQMINSLICDVLGPVGEKGHKGERGLDGLQGPQGRPGEKGAWRQTAMPKSSHDLNHQHILKSASSILKFFLLYWKLCYNTI